jgi:methyl-accepting chemotaxis protein
LIKLIKRLILLSIVLSVGFIYISIDSGGRPFRQFGDTIKRGTEEMAEAADVIKQSSESIKKTARRTDLSLRRARTGIEEAVTKILQMADKTGDAVKETSLYLRRGKDDAAMSAMATGGGVNGKIMPQ